MPEVRPGIDAVDPPAVDDRKVGLGQCRLQLDHDAAGDLVLEVQRISAFDLVPGGPQLACGTSFHELNRHPHAIERASYAARYNVAHAKLGAGLTDVDGAPGIGK